MTDSWLLYGANGYTGELIAREAVRRGMRPVLAGRSRIAIEQLAAQLSCPHRVFSLDDHTALVDALQDQRAVLNCAGPFSATARSMMQGCLATHVHYLDITGEIDVFELAHSVTDKAQRAGIVLCPGVGFDVVPTDSIAAKLKEALPDATTLALGFESKSGVSKGTAKTMLESVADGCKLRRDGKIVSVPFGSLTRRIDFGGGERLGIAISWGDVSTAYYTTGIPNIEVFIAGSSRTLRRQRRLNWLRPFVRRRFVLAMMKRRIDATVTPPDQTKAANQPTFVWGEARNAAGEVRTARLTTPNGYALTVHSALGILERLLAEPHRAGFMTPSMLVGADFVTTLPGCSSIRIEP